MRVEVEKNYEGSCDRIRFTHTDGSHRTLNIYGLSDAATQFINGQRCALGIDAIQVLDLCLAIRHVVRERDELRAQAEDRGCTVCHKYREERDEVGSCPHHGKVHISVGIACEHRERRSECKEVPIDE